MRYWKALYKLPYFITEIYKYIMYCDTREEATRKEPSAVSLQLLPNNSPTQKGC